MEDEIIQNGTVVTIRFNLADPDQEHRLHRMLAADELCSFVWDCREYILRRWRKGDIKAEDAMQNLSDMVHELDHIMAHYQ